MLQRAKFLLFSILVIQFTGFAQQAVQVDGIKKNNKVLPGKVVNLAYFLINQTEEALDVTIDFNIPERWKIVTSQKEQYLLPPGKKFSVLSLQVPSSETVGNYKIEIKIAGAVDESMLFSGELIVQVEEFEKLEIQMLKNSEYVFSGENIEATYLVQNLGNTVKNIHLETHNCEVAGSSEISI